MFPIAENSEMGNFSFLGNIIFCYDSYYAEKKMKKENY